MFYWDQLDWNLYGLFEWDRCLITFDSYDALYAYCQSNNIDAAQR